MRVQPAAGPVALDTDLVLDGDCLDALAALPDGAFDLAYLDPPFNTGRTQRARRLRTVRYDADGDRTGFGGRRYRTEAGAPGSAYADACDDGRRFDPGWLHSIVPAGSTR